MHLSGLKRVAFTAAIAVGSSYIGVGCSPPNGSAIEVIIEVDPGVKSSCIRLVAKSAGGEEVLSEPTPRKERIEAAIFPTAQLAGTVSFRARGYFGKGCEEPLTLNDESPELSETFAKGQIRHVTLALEPPARDLDVDGDGFRATAAGGPDCLDTSSSVNPGLPESCNDGLDNNCDLRSDCADSTCLGAACSDGVPCTRNDLCLADGSCAGAKVNCDVPAALACTVTGACDPVSGACVYTPIAPGTACDDGDSCTRSDRCLADAGCGGTAVTCATSPGPCFAALGACLRDGGACAYPARDAGAACDDGNACTFGELCSAAGSCDGVPISCTTPPGACFAAPGSCDPDAGCTYLVTVGTSCSDTDPCTLSESCQPDGGCSGPAPITCNAPPNSCFGAAGACLSDGGCDYAVNPGGLFLPCDGGVCRPDGGCLPPRFPYGPSNFDPVAVAAGGITPSVTLNCLADFDSTPGAATPFVGWCGQAQPALQTAPQDGGPDAVVLAMYRFNIDSSGALRVKGTRPVIFAVYDSARISGQLLAAANLATPGAGGSSPACGASTGGDGGLSGVRGGGGGGGGFATRGADGGAANSGVATIGAGGAAAGSVGLAPLRGGCSGGAGGTASAQAGAGGAGGGAIQLSVAHALTVDGTLSASGGGGLGAFGSSSGGGAGGSGGAVLLEAEQLALSSTARVTANGGGGGEGASASAAGGDGQNGGVGSATPAAGGTSGPGNAGNGGSGGAGTTPPGPGQGATQSGGGGGGAAGRIRLNGNGTCTVNAAAVVSPPASTQGCP